MADQSIGTLPKIETLADDALFAAEQQGAAGRISGAQIKEFAKDGVDQYVTAAQEAAQKALEAAEKALKAVEDVEGAADEAAAAQAASQAATAAQEAAEAAQKAAETARDQAQAIAGGNFLSIAGGTLTGPLILSGAPTEDNGAANKKYVDDAVDSGTLMKKENYDPTGAVASAGGIPAYVAENAGSDDIYLTIITKNDDGTYTADHTYEEIDTARTSGKLLAGKYGNVLLLYRGWFTYEDTYYHGFASGVHANGYTLYFKIYADASITLEELNYLQRSQLSSAIDSTSTTTPANSAAVKKAYDKAAAAAAVEAGTYTIEIGSLYSAYSISQKTQKYIKIGDLLFLQLCARVYSETSDIRTIIMGVTGLPSGTLSAHHQISNGAELQVETSHISLAYANYSANPITSIEINTVIPLMIS